MIRKTRRSGRTAKRIFLAPPLLGLFAILEAGRVQYAAGLFRFAMFNEPAGGPASCPNWRHRLNKR
jgi:hypothetical protein